MSSPKNGDSLWYKDAVLYEVHVRAYYDSDGDGIGDFQGLTQKLDYLQDLGVTALWLLPFYPSPLRDDGYDIADYTGVNPSYGDMRDVRQLVREAHRRGLKVFTELVCNHTSDQHPWFQRARAAAPGSAARNFYVWSDTSDKYSQARIIFKDFETSNWTWDPVAQAYYWHRFYHHQPDLNFDNPQVRRAITRVMDTWFEMGIDGLRLDAVPYLYEREDTNCENLPETHGFLRELRSHVDAKFKDRVLLAEANQWPEDAVAYFGDGDECHMSFHFPLMPRLFMALRMEDRFPIIDILAQTPSIPDNSQWALFLRNHDELTLEMVTDEERDYMWRSYTSDPEAKINLGIRHRLAPLLRNDRRRMEAMNGLLFALPGTPVIYYGDEIGMGDNIYLGDRDSVRTPMQWSPDRNAGFSSAPRQRLYLPVISDHEYHYEAVNAQSQQQNPHSLLSWMKRLIALRKRYRAFGRGSLEFLQPENRKVLAFLRRYEDEIVLVVANLSRFAQPAELDLREFNGMVPVEVFSQQPFPPVGELPYFITLGPHGFYWFSMERREGAAPSWAGGSTPLEVPVLTGVSAWEALARARGRTRLTDVLPAYLLQRRWFGGKARGVRAVRTLDAIRVAHRRGTSYVLLLEVEHGDGDADTYVLPLSFASGEAASSLLQRNPGAVVARLEGRDAGVLYDAVNDEDLAGSLLEAIRRRRRFRGGDGTLIAMPTRAFSTHDPGEAPASTVSGAEQSNTSIVYADQLILKLFRRTAPGLNPDLEIGRFLTERTGFKNIAPVAGSLEYQPTRGEAMTVGVLHGFVPNQGDAWGYTLSILNEYLTRSARRLPERPPPAPGGVVRLAMDELPTHALESVGFYIDSARLLGRRTAEMHAALASDRKDPEFAPQPSTVLDHRSLYQSMRSLAKQTLQSVARERNRLPADVQAQADSLVAQDAELDRRLRAVMEARSPTTRIRCHGDYHLGQDFVIVDFEGEPARRLNERRVKRSPLRDVAGLLRSFDYAAHSANRGKRDELGAAVDWEGLDAWARNWSRWVSAACLRTYLEVAAGADFLPPSPAEVEILLDAFMLDKALYELRYELNNRPDWIHLPLAGILQLLNPDEG